MRRSIIRYLRNRPITGDARYGKRVPDDVTGVWTREKRLVTDAYGNRVDPRDDGAYDNIRDSLDGNENN